MEGKIYTAQRAWDRAEAALSKALQLEPNYLNAYEVLISVYIATNKLPQAIGELQTYLSKKADDPRALMTLAVIYEKQKDWLKARDAYERLLAKNPEFVGALNNLAYVYADKLNEPDKAYELARKARELQGADPSIADTLGWALYKRRLPTSAGTISESSGKLAQDPNSEFHLGC
jgi:tetratricopeptide (TPR) repeat protein